MASNSIQNMSLVDGRPSGTRRGLLDSSTHVLGSRVICAEIIDVMGLTSTYNLVTQAERCEELGRSVIARRGGKDPEDASIENNNP
jgi:hypothetical protein